MSPPPLKNRRRGQAGLGVEDVRLPSLTAIRAFEAAARLGSFAKAAAELDTTSASVSYHVRRLEQQIGVQLFFRHAQKVELTVPGQLVATEATQAFAALRASFIKALDTDESHLTLTTLPTFGTTWLTPRLGKFRSLHPEITLTLDLSVPAHDLTEGCFDAAIRNGHGHWPGLRTVPLFPSIFMPLCSPRLKAAAKNIANPHAQLDVPLLGRPDWWAAWYRAQGCPDDTLPGEFGTSLPTEYLDIAAAVAGHGIAIGSPILFRAEITSGRLVPAHDFVATDGRSFWMVFPSAKEHRPKIARFREWLCSEVEEDLHAARDYIRRAKPG
ncbi:LysR substrate-binding domain-containing protein [Dyella nitratireducens]|uniref:LysR family transcriptional regulator n=1 Tax=Dyella nitratireducens TaxID=1849580 RepID=A0ABQ1GA19_9GAMM|nr:LysR substrate-binding domain-containing protein [Dyella nitratireducens]GGA39704.1 LysR family transcriptional regulator [Dyella nitratireducens]GLQ40475.1 LysR family transcriptional regulator [Dyella nitratireducens]